MDNDIRIVKVYRIFLNYNNVLLLIYLNEIST